jgi:hypothetical protein
MKRQNRLILYGLAALAVLWWVRRGSGVAGLNDGADITYRMGTTGDPMYGGPQLYGMGDAFSSPPSKFRPQIVRYPVPVIDSNEDNWTTVNMP